MNKINFTPPPWEANQIVGWQEVFEPYEIIGPDNRVVGLIELYCNGENDLPIILAAPKTYSACKHAFEMLDFHGTDDPDLVAYGYIAFPVEVVDALFNELAGIIAKVERKPE